MKKRFLITSALVAMLSVCGCTMLPGEVEIPSEITSTSEKPSYVVDTGSWDAPEQTSEIKEEPPVTLNPEYDFAAHNPNEWQQAYYDFINDLPKSSGADESFMEENQYFLADIDDKFGAYVPELCIRKGTCEADYELEIYTFDTKSGEVDQLVGPGVIGAGHTTFYVGPNGNLYGDWGHMGYQSVTEYSDISGKVTAKEVFSEDLNKKPDDVNYTTMSEIFGEETNECLMLPVSNPAGLIWYLNLPYPTSSEANQADCDQAFTNGLDNTKDIYLVSSSPYFSCKEGWVTVKDLTKPGVLYEGDSNSYMFSNYVYTDVNFDGQDELLLKLTSEKADKDGENQYTYVLLSYQDGIIYGYAMPYLASDGNVYVVHYSVYRNWVVENYGYRSVEGFIFDKNLCTFVYSDQEVKDPEKNTAVVWQQFYQDFGN